VQKNPPSTAGIRRNSPGGWYLTICCYQSVQGWACRLKFWLCETGVPQLPVSSKTSGCLWQRLNGFETRDPSLLPGATLEFVEDYFGQSLLSNFSMVNWKQVLSENKGCNLELRECFTSLYRRPVTWPICGNYKWVQVCHQATIVSSTLSCFATPNLIAGLSLQSLPSSRPGIDACFRLMAKTATIIRISSHLSPQTYICFTVDILNGWNIKFVLESGFCFSRTRIQLHITPSSYKRDQGEALSFKTPSAMFPRFCEIHCSNQPDCSAILTAARNGDSILHVVFSSNAKYRLRLRWLQRKYQESFVESLVQWVCELAISSFRGFDGPVAE